MYAQMYRSLLLLLIAVGSSCAPTPAAEQLPGDAFFDLSGYIDAQVDSLQALQPTVTKTIVLNGTEETKELTNLDFGADLRVFREADINKPAYRDKYRVERHDEGRMLITIYTATDSSMQTRELAISTVRGTPEQITIRRKTGTVLSDGNHLLEYRPDYGYRMRTVQVNRFGDDLNASIAVEWTQKKR